MRSNAVGNPRKHPTLPAGEIEAAVVDQVRAVSRDTRLRDEIIRQAMEGIQQGRKELESQQTQLTRQLTRDHGEVQQLALEQRPNNSVVYRIADVQERIGSLTDFPIQRMIPSRG